METLIRSFEHAGLTVEIHLDPMPTSPRENDNVAILYLWPDRNHSYKRGFAGSKDVECPCDFEDFRRWLAGQIDPCLDPDCAEDTDEILARFAYVEPVTLDSGKGFAFVSISAAVKNWPAAIDVDLDAKVRECVRAEVAEFAAWCRGDVYGYIVRDPETQENLDSCWGFVGASDDAEAEGRASAGGIAADRAATKRAVGMVTGETRID